MIFYADPMKNIEAVGSDITHLVFYGDFFKRRYPGFDGPLCRLHLEQAGWTEIWQTVWNGFDILQDDTLRQGGLHVLERTLRKGKASKAGSENIQGRS